MNRIILNINQNIYKNNREQRFKLVCKIRGSNIYEIRLKTKASKKLKIQKKIR